MLGTIGIQRAESTFVAAVVALVSARSTRSTRQAVRAREARHAGAISPVVGHGRRGGVGGAHIQNASPAPRAGGTGLAGLIRHADVPSVAITGRGVGTLYRRHGVSSAAYGHKAARAVGISRALVAGTAVGSVEARIANTVCDFIGTSG